MPLFQFCHAISVMRYRGSAWGGVLFCAVFLAFAGFVANNCLLADQAAVGLKDDSAHITKLIAMLGNSNYATREKAQAELSRLGLDAFDALLDAQNHDDLEVALRARYLVQSMKIGWVRDDDPSEVKAILRGYEAAGPDHRRTILNRLALKEAYLGTDALCRLARFETHEVLSKKAALMVMLQDTPPDEPALEQQIERIQRAVGASRRTGATWLRTYIAVVSQQDGALKALNQLVQGEQDLYSLMPDRSSKAIIGDLLLWQADILRQRGQQAAALDVIVRRLNLLDDGRMEVMETLNWMIHHRAWDMIDEVKKRFAVRFAADAEFLYRLAEARMQQGRVEDARGQAARAFALKPDDATEHKRLGVVLQTRGMFDWAEREFRHVLKQGPAGTVAHLEAYLYLSELLYDQRKAMAGAIVLQQLVDLAEQDETVKQQIVDLRGDLSPVLARMHFFYAEHYGLNGKADKQVEHLQAAIEVDPADADVLIAMFRAPSATEELRTKTSLFIRQTAAQYLVEIERYNQFLERSIDEETREFAVVRLASLYNRYAWLIGNTEGDYDSALLYSHRSLELRPGTGGYLDTLGRCYFAKGDYANAVKYQKQAVRDDPHSGAIQRQLKQFQQALARKEAHSDNGQ